MSGMNGFETVAPALKHTLNWKQDLLHSILNKRYSNISFLIFDFRFSFTYTYTFCYRRYTVIHFIFRQIDDIVEQYCGRWAERFTIQCIRKVMLYAHPHIKDFLVGRRLCGLWKIIIQKSKQYLAFSSISNKQEAENIWFLNMRRHPENILFLKQHRMYVFVCINPKVTAVNHLPKSNSHIMCDMITTYNHTLSPDSSWFMALVDYEMCVVLAGFVQFFRNFFRILSFHPPHTIHTIIRRCYAIFNIRFKSGGNRQILQKLDH